MDISLDPSLLQLASGAISYDNDNDSAAVKDLIKGIRGIYVRSYTFDRPGEYSKADVKAVNIVGSISLAKLAQRQGQFGMPRVGITVNGQAENGSADSQTH